MITRVAIGGSAHVARIGHQSATHLRVTGGGKLSFAGNMRKFEGGGMIDQAEFEPGHWRERAREIRALCSQIADVRARDELLKIATEYELIAKAMRFPSATSIRTAE